MSKRFAPAMARGLAGRQGRAERALVRQLDYQRRKAAAYQGQEREVVAERAAEARRVAGLLAPWAPEAPRVLEVGSGAHGLVFFLGAARAVGVDPLAAHYARLFPGWQAGADTAAAAGERLPFAGGAFDLVLCDNVVDHAGDPAAIAAELARVLRPGGLLYFTVNIHHRFYHWASLAHGLARALGAPFEVGPFADHTVHLTLAAARGLFAGLPLRPLSEGHSIAEARALARVAPPRHLGDRLKRVFFKNAVYRLIAVRE
ncbi:MAG TPA: class I SAM-dependent methyltransferase [Herpetosiphonaceae bacterium]|nr:class I SAM-dependent methyltransferase [Herpetosiphonaceae bacterium]